MPQPIKIQNPDRVREKPPVGRSAAMQQEVLKHLGRPDDLQRVHVIRLFDENHYRVNVYREVGGIGKLTDSFYVKVVADGLIFSPPPKRKYHGDVIDRFSGATA